MSGTAFLPGDQGKMTRVYQVPGCEIPARTGPDYLVVFVVSLRSGFVKEKVERQSSFEFLSLPNGFHIVIFLEKHQFIESIETSVFGWCIDTATVPHGNWIAHLEDHPTEAALTTYWDLKRPF